MSPRHLLLAATAVLCALLMSGCGNSGEGGAGVQIPRDDPQWEGAMTFNQACGACHTLAAAGTVGSATSIGSIEYKDGPNLNAKLEDYEDVLYAIRNGGFSGQQMPANLVTGKDAERVACFVATYSGSGRPKTKVPGSEGASDTAGCESKLDG